MLRIKNETNDRLLFLQCYTLFNLSNSLVSFKSGFLISRELLRASFIYLFVKWIEDKDHENMFYATQESRIHGVGSYILIS